MASHRTVAVALAAALVLGNALGRGGVDPAALWSSAAASAVMLILSGRRSETRVSVSALAVGLAVCTGWIALQLVPLPAPFLRLVSPNTVAVLEDPGLDPVGCARWYCVSLHPAETARELAQAVTLTLIVAAAGVLARSARRRDQLLLSIAVSGVAVAAVYVATAAAGLAPLVEPRVSFVNPNHFAGYLLIVAFTQLGFASRAHGPKRIAWVVAFAMTASELLLTLSRAGISALFVGAAAFVLLGSRWYPARTVTPEAPAARVRRHGAPIVIVAVSAALALAAFLALDPIVSEFRSVRGVGSEQKIGVFVDTVRMLRHFPVTGIGRGAFADMYTSFKLDPVQMTFTHVENEWLQLPVELGLPVGLLVIGLFAWAFAAAASRRDLSRPLAGALAGAAALAAQSVFDFSLETLGTAVLFAIVLGIASRFQSAQVIVRREALAVVAALGLVVAATALWVYSNHDDDVVAVVAASSPDAAMSIARAVGPWHPTDYAIPGSIGQKLARAGRCREAVPWLSRAVLRNPTAPEPHSALAACFARSGQDVVAAREYRLAFNYGDTTALADAAARYTAPGALLGIAPDTPDGLVAAGALLRSRPLEAAEAWRRAWESFGDVRALSYLAGLQLEQGVPEEALRLARALQQVAPMSEFGYLVAQRSLDALERPEEAERELALGIARLPGSEGLLVARGDRQLRRQLFSNARATFEGIVARDPPTLKRKRLWIARALEAQGRVAEALGQVQAARDVMPRDADALLMFGRLASAVGRLDEAIEAVELASRSADADQGTCEKMLSQLRAARQQKK